MQRDGTRRNILSVYSSIFDPLGLIQPFILKLKLLIQDLSRLKCGGDEKIPDKVNNEWQIWGEEISKLTDYVFPRCIIPKCSYKRAELHVFSDSSKFAYSAVCYGRFIYEDSLIVVILFYIWQIQGESS